MVAYRRKRTPARRKKTAIRTIRRRKFGKRRLSRVGRKRTYSRRRTTMAKTLRAISRNTRTTATSTRLTTSGKSYVKLHTSRRRFMKTYIAKQMMRMNPLQRKIDFPETTAVDTSTMSFNWYDTGTNLINQCSFGAFAVSNPNYYSKWLAMSRTVNAVPSNDESVNVLFKKGNVTCEFKNENASACEIDVWVFYPRRDFPVPPTTGNSYSPLKAPGSANMAGNPPLLSWGIVNTAAESNTLFGSGTGIDAGRDVTPFMSGQWCSMLRASKTRPRHITLQGGQSFNLSLTDWNSRVISMKKYGLFDGTTIEDNYSYMKEMGPIVLVRVRGCLSHDESTTTGALQNKDLKPLFGPYSVTGTLRYSHDIAFPLQSTYDNLLAGKVRYQTGVFGFTGSAPYNTVSNITNVDTRTAFYNPEVVFNT